VYLRHPTTGGVLATWGSLGDITVAQPGALVGFLGPRVYEGLYGEPFPAGVQTAEGLAAAGVVDGVAGPAAWRDMVANALVAYHSRPAEGPDLMVWGKAGADDGIPGAAASSLLNPPTVIGGWAAVAATRAADRPGLRELLERVAGWVPLSGTQAGESAAATLAGVGRIEGLGCVIVGFDRTAQADGSLVGPADLRLARRAMALAERWALPLVTVVDTQGGELSAAAERGALAGEIARCLADMSQVRAPTLSVLLGGGAGGVALALLPADRVLAVSDGWVTPLPPEGASLIRHRTTDRAADMADSQRITAVQLADAGAVDRVIDPPTPDMAAVAAAISEELSRLAARPVDLGARADRWSGLGR
jgi:acetyl-CoA carboxylase alpha subunit